MKFQKIEYKLCIHLNVSSKFVVVKGFILNLLKCEKQLFKFYWIFKLLKTLHFLLRRPFWVSWSSLHSSETAQFCYRAFIAFVLGYSSIFCIIKKTDMSLNKWHLLVCEHVLFTREFVEVFIRRTSLQGNNGQNSLSSMTDGDDKRWLIWKSLTFHFWLLTKLFLILLR